MKLTYVRAGIYPPFTRYECRECGAVFTARESYSPPSYCPEHRHPARRAKPVAAKVHPYVARSMAGAHPGQQWK